MIPKTHTMSEAEWRGLGVQQSLGWVGCTHCFAGDLINYEIFFDAAYLFRARFSTLSSFLRFTTCFMALSHTSCCSGEQIASNCCILLQATSSKELMWTIRNYFGARAVRLPFYYYVLFQQLCNQDLQFHKPLILSLIHISEPTRPY